ncbi:unnamed protein product [Amoebophrya sp. A25]|nr:unnamed protein product [Amoebophrya sp. A25]|eukprot:GSA25T00002212001.1
MRPSPSFGNNALSSSQVQLHEDSDQEKGHEKIEKHQEMRRDDSGASRESSKEQGRKVPSCIFNTFGAQTGANLLHGWCAGAVSKYLNVHDHWGSTSDGGKGKDEGDAASTASRKKFEFSISAPNNVINGSRTSEGASRSQGG